MGGDILDWMMDHIFPWFIIIACVAAVGIVVLLVYDYSVAEKFSLLKREWICTASHTKTSTAYVQSGNMLLPIESKSTVCDQWTRKPE